MEKGKNKRINRIIKAINEEHFSGIDKTNKNPTTKTLLVKIQDKQYDNQWYFDEEKKKILDQILDDAEEKRQEVLQKCFEMFKNNPLDLIENAASIVNLEKNKIDLELYNDENGEMVKTQFICPECGKNEFVYVNVKKIIKNLIKLL